MALALAVVVGLSALSTRRVLEPPPAPAVTAPAPAPPQAPAPVPFVMLSFTSEPAGAEVRGPAHDLYGVTPFSRAFPRSNEAQVIEFTRSGYAATHVQVTPSVTRAISVTLARAGHPRARPHGKRLGSEKTIDPFRR
jgi:hypothetical protein